MTEAPSDASGPAPVGDGRGRRPGHGSTGRGRPWQLRLLEELQHRASSVQEVTQVWVLGSARDPSGLDRWSDLDVGLVLAGDVQADRLLGPQDVVWAIDHQSSGRRASCRLVFSDGRRLDLVCADRDELAAAGGRCLSPGDGRLGGSGRLIAPAAPDPEVNSFRFLAAQTVVKLSRADLLIGSHLLLELARLCLVQAMLLRDRDEAATRHRFGTARDAVAADVWRIVRSADTVPDPDQVESLAAVFDLLRAELDPTYVADWSGLQALTSP